jgi:hypothetical protein
LQEEQDVEEQPEQASDELLDLNSPPLEVPNLEGNFSKFSLLHFMQYAFSLILKVKNSNFSPQSLHLKS